tara:strand:+ start:9257 stop:10729 length:1473 start_codon:yes stop_codon:yes gene_type:complete
MKRNYSYTFLCLLLFLALSNCETSSSNDEISISGIVVDGNSGNPISEAIVKITSPNEIADLSVITSSDGIFSFNQLSISDPSDVLLSIRKTGYNSKSVTVAVSSGLDIELENPVSLTAEVIDGGGDNDGVSGTPTGAAAIILDKISEETINIKESGGIANSSFTFQVQDSAGRSLNLSNTELVTFSIINGPGGGEGITPIEVNTNGNGTVTSNLFSGNKAGVVQIQAEIIRDDLTPPLIIRSRPVSITIHGGFPDENHFSIAPAKYNFEGYSINGNTNELTVILGDEFSNPVKPGTAVYFNSTGGIIEGSGSGNTNSQGFVSVNLISGEPRPSDSQTIDGVAFPRLGLATLTAQTVNTTNDIIEKSVNVIFSTSGAIITANPTTFDIPAGGGATFDFTVTDLNGNPMAAGTTISINAGEGMEVTGDNEVTLGNHIFPGSGSTDFTFSIRDTDEESNAAADLSIKITVVSPGGEETTASPINGTRRKIRSN